MMAAARGSWSLGRRGMQPAIFEYLQILKVRIERQIPDLPLLWRYKRFQKMRIGKILPVYAASRLHLES